MGSLKRRLRTLEAKRETVPAITEEELQSLSDEDLDALEDSLEHDLEHGAGNFRTLYRMVSERTRRACEALFDALEAARRGENPPSRDPPEEDAYTRLERIAAGDEAARQEWEERNGYRVWKYFRK